MHTATPVPWSCLARALKQSRKVATKKKVGKKAPKYDRDALWHGMALVSLSCLSHLIIRKNWATRHLERPRVAPPYNFFLLPSYGCSFSFLFYFTFFPPASLCVCVWFVFPSIIPNTWSFAVGKDRYKVRGRERESE